MPATTAEEKREIIRAYKRTLSTPKVSRLTGRSLPTITRILKDAGVMKGFIHVTQEEIAEGKRLLDEGRSLKYIRRHTRYRVINHLIAEGHYKRGLVLFDYSTLDWTAIKEEYLKGVSLLKLQKKYGGSYEAFVPNFKKRFPGLCMLPTEQRAYAADLKWSQLLNHDVSARDQKREQRGIQQVETHSRP
jgi:hypothetical protein